MAVLFIAKQGAVLALLLFTAAGAGTLAAGPRGGIALRSAIGLALCAHAMFFLAAIGQLRILPIVAVMLVAMAGGLLRGLARERPPWLVIASAPVFFLALFPPVAFDETLYHLPFVRAFARNGALRFLPDLRFPVFPQLHELLCVPAFLLAGDLAPHLVSLAEVIITAALLVEWGRSYDDRAGWLAAAAFLGSPIVIYLSTILYADAALTLFVAAAFYALDRERFALAGFFFGTACGVKYLGGYFALAALVILVVRATDRRRAVAAFVLACAAAALPTTGWIVLQTHNPVFPVFGTSMWAAHLRSVPFTERTKGMLRVIWDVTFERQRMGLEPPLTPFLAALVAVVVAAAVRDVRARCVALLSAGYLLAFSFLPQDSRYLVPLLPLFSVVVAVTVVSRWPKSTTLLAALAIAPGIAYAGYRIAVQGMPPQTPAQRAEWIARRVPESRALVLAGTERVYVCGGEQLKGHAGGELLGDFTGPYSYDRILGGVTGTTAIAKRLRGIGVRYFLVAKRACTPPPADGGMDLVHEDAHAQLWRVRSAG